MKKQTPTLLQIMRKNDQEMKKNAARADKALVEFMRKHKKAFKVLARY